MPDSNDNGFAKHLELPNRFSPKRLAAPLRRSPPANRVIRCMLGGCVLPCFTAAVSYILLQMVFHLARPKVALTVSWPAVTMRAESSWNPIDFFHDSATLELCAAISSRDYFELDRLLKQPRDLNETGKAGLSVLHWAFIANDLEAFERLLKAGASPDIVHTDNFVQGSIGFLKGSTFPLDCLQYGREKLAFFDATLPYLQSPNQRSPATDQ